MSVDRTAMSDVGGIPGSDPRTWCAVGHVSDNPDGIDVTDDACYVDVVLPTDVDVDEFGQLHPLVLTAQWLFPSVGNGGIVYARPERGQPCLVLVNNGDPDAGLYAMPLGRTLGGTIPDAILNDDENMHIIPPSGALLLLAQEGAADTTMKKAARIDDEVQVTIESGALGNLPAEGSSYPATQITVTGKITKGSSRVKIGGDSEDP